MMSRQILALAFLSASTVAAPPPDIHTYAQRCDAVAEFELIAISPATRDALGVAQIRIKRAAGIAKLPTRMHLILPKQPKQDPPYPPGFFYWPNMIKAQGVSTMPLYQAVPGVWTSTQSILYNPINWGTIERTYAGRKVDAALLDSRESTARYLMGNELAAILKDKPKLTAMVDALVAKHVPREGARTPELLAKTAEWIKALDSDAFAAREAAAAELTKVAPSIVPELQKAAADASVERAARAKTIVDAVLETQGQVVLAAAVSALADKARADVLVALLDSPHAPARAAAIDALTILVGKPLEFDPLAAPDARRTALAKVKANLR